MAATDPSPAERAALVVWNAGSPDTTGMLAAVRAAVETVREDIAAAILERRDSMYPDNGTTLRAIARRHFTDSAEIARHGQVRSMLDVLLEGDTTGHFQAIADADKADLAAGITWGVYRGGVLVGTHPARYMAEADARDGADANDIDVSEYEIRPVGEKAMSDDQHAGTERETPPYTYFVSYAHGGGLGSVEVNTSGRIDCWAAVEQVTALAAQALAVRNPWLEFNPAQIVILNWILLSGPRE